MTGTTSEAMAGAPRVPWRHVWFAFALTIVLLVVMGATGVDISAARDFERDAVQRDAVSPAPGAPERYLDPSPVSIWLPSDLFVWDSLRSGHLPLWQRRQGGGYSVVVTVFAGVFHPVRWLMAFFPRDFAPSALIVMALALAWIGMYALAAGELGLSPTGAIFAACAFALSAATISFVHFSGAILAIAHLPWILLLQRRALRKSRNSFALLALAIALLIISGHPSIELAVAAAAGGVAFMDSVNTRSARPLLVLGGAGAAAVLLAAFALLPPLLARPDLWSYKTESAYGYAYAIPSFAAWLSQGSAALFDRYDPTRSCVDSRSFFGYLGLPLIALALVGVSFLSRAKQNGVLWLLVVAFLVVMPGPWMSPLAIKPLVYIKPWYLLCAFTFFFVWVAAAGADALLRSRSAWQVALVTVLMAAVVGLHGWRAWEVLRPRHWRRIDSGPVIQFLRRDHDRYRVTGLWGQTHLPNASQITGIEDVRLCGPMFSERYRLWWQLIDPEVQTRSFPTIRITDRLDSPLLGDFNVKYVLQSRLPPLGTFFIAQDGRARDAALSPYLSAPRFPVLARAPSAEVRANARFVRPRAHFAETVVGVRNLGEAVRTLAARGGIPWPAVVETSSSLEGVPPLARGSVSVSYPADARVAMQVQSATGGLVVLHDAFDRGWHATVDGRAAPVLAVNVLSRGVVVPAGVHRIEMAYTPPGSALGVVISAVTLLVVFLAPTLIRRMGRSSSTVR